MVAEIAKFVRLDFVFFGFGVIHVALAGAESPRAFYHALLADEVGGLDGIGFVGGAEDEAIAEIQGQHFGFVVAKRRHKRRCALCGGDNRCACLADHVHAVVIARAVLAGRHKSLRFVSPQDEQIIFGAVGFGFVEATQRVIVVKQLEHRVHIPSLRLEFLRHGREDDFALVNRSEVERAFPSAEHLGDFGCQEVLQIVADGFADAAKLLVGLGEEAVCEVSIHGGAARCFQKVFQILHFFFKKFAVGQQLESPCQRDGTIQLKQHFKRVSDVRLRLAFEKAFVPALAETRGGVHDELGVGRERDAAVAGQVVAIGRRPLRVGVVRPDLQLNQVVFAAVVSRHRREGFPIDAFFVNAQAAPHRLILKNLMNELIDAGTRFARASVAGDEPAATKLIPPPPQTAELRHMVFAW